MPEVHLSHLFCGLIVLSRGLDMFSTWLVTPKLKLEANPAMKNRNWTTLFLINLPLLGIPYLHLGFSVTIVVVSCLVSGNTLSSAALTRGLGERGHLESIKRAIQGNSLSKALAMNTLGATVVIGTGILLMLLAKNPWQDLTWWGALGVVAYGLTALVHLNFSLVRLFQRVKKPAVDRPINRKKPSLEIIELEFTPAQYDEIASKARLFGHSVEEFCRMTALESKARVR